MARFGLFALLALHSISTFGSAFVGTQMAKTVSPASLRQNKSALYSSNNDDPAFLGVVTKGGFTVKQRLREEVESPFRKVRLLFFSLSTGSALTALYFSMLNTIKAYVGGYSDAIPLDEALTSDAINIGAAVICGVLAFREYNVGQANLERISRGGKLAALPVEPAAGGALRKLADYRRNYRVLIAAGGEEYIAKLARSLNADQLEDVNVIPEKLQETDVVVVPVLLSKSDGSVADTRAYWTSIEAGSEQDRNFDITRADSVVAFPKANGMWKEYLKGDIKTATGQGFDVMEKGITLTIKKNGRILRRATGQPAWGDFIGAMEVLDGSQFGMPGDSEKYGGP